MQQAAKSIACGTQATICFRGPVQLSDELDHCPCAERHTGYPHPNNAGAAGAVKRPVVPHAPTAKRNKDDRRALGPEATRGDDARLCVARMRAVPGEAR